MGLTKAFGKHSGYKVQVETPVLNTIYIDPTNSTSGRDGSIANPYNSFSEVTLTNGWYYLTKRGTTMTRSTALSASGLSNVFFGTYGVGNKPIFNYTGGGSYGFYFNPTDTITVKDIDFTTPRTTNINTLVEVAGTNLTLDGCKIYNVQGVGDGTLAGIGIRGGGTNLRILSCEVDDVDCDGMYLRDTSNLEIGYTSITNINQKYATIGTGASGDGIQIDGVWPNFHIHDCLIDRSDANTGNKFGIICNSASGINSSSAGIIERCVFKTNGNVDWALFIEQGNGIQVRYNRFEGLTQAVRIVGIYCLNHTVHHNIFVNCSVGVGVAYTAGSPTNTKVLNNIFHKLTGYNIWVDRTSVEARNNVHFYDGASGAAFNNYGSGVITQSNACYGDALHYGNVTVAPNSVIGNPSFVDVANGDYSLGVASICRSAGIDVGLTEDYAGNIITGTNVEIGIYEY